MTDHPRPEETFGRALCPKCGRQVLVVKDDHLCTHGPGPEEGVFICSGSGLAVKPPDLKGAPP